MNALARRGREDEFARLVLFFRAVAAELGSPLPARPSVLDFGCGSGEGVTAWRESGADAVGCDIVLGSPGAGLFRIQDPYRLPFDDETFDLIVSNQVLEHVQDHDVAFSEMSRVLKPSGLSLHVFPARWSPVETHVKVPLASVLQVRWWLTPWALLGIRNEFQAGLSWREVREMNFEYLRTRTNYLSRRRIVAAARPAFAEVRFVEEVALKYGRRTQRLHRFVEIFPPTAHVYSALRSRCLLLRGSELSRDHGGNSRIVADAEDRS